MVATATLGISRMPSSRLNWGSWAFAFLLFAPYILVFSRFREFPSLDASEFWWALRFTFAQAALSALVATGVGLLMGCGLWMISSSQVRRVGQVLCVLPSFLPSLFVILLFFEIVPDPHLGLSAIVLVQGFIYAGFVAALWLSWLEQQGSRLIETALVLGAGSWRLLLLILRTHSSVAIRWCFLVFAICVSAFAIPIALGGGHGTTIEVLIFEKIRGVSDRSQALTLSLLQAALLWTLSLSLRPLRRNSTTPGGEFRQVFPRFLPLLPLLYIFVLAWGLMGLARDAWGQTVDFAWPLFAVRSFLLGLTAGGLFLLWSLWFVAVWSPQLSRFLRGYSAPSMTLMGLALLLWQPDSSAMQMLAYAAALVLLVGPALLRSGPEPLRESLSGQCDVAIVMGASRWTVLWQVLWPQMRRNLTVTAGLACLWMMGDFALAKVFLSEDWTLAQIIYGLVNAYRLNQAALLMLGLLFLGAIGFLIFWGIGYVRRFESAQKNR